MNDKGMCTLPRTQKLEMCPYQWDPKGANPLIVGRGCVDENVLHNPYLVQYRLSRSSTCTGTDRDRHNYRSRWFSPWGEVCPDEPAISWKTLQATSTWRHLTYWARFSLTAHCGTQDIHSQHARDGWLLPSMHRAWHLTWLDQGKLKLQNSKCDFYLSTCHLCTIKK